MAKYMYIKLSSPPAAHQRLFYRRKSVVLLYFLDWPVLGHSTKRLRNEKSRSLALTGF